MFLKPSHTSFYLALGAILAVIVCSVGDASAGSATGWCFDGAGTPYRCMGGIIPAVLICAEATILAPFHSPTLIQRAN